LVQLSLVNDNTNDDTNEISILALFFLSISIYNRNKNVCDCGVMKQ
jgi:hypothetical protein